MKPQMCCRRRVLKYEHRKNTEQFGEMKILGQIQLNQHSCDKN